MSATIDGVHDVRLWCDRQEEQPAREALWQVRERARPSVQEPRQRRAGMWPRWCEPIVRDMRQRDPNGLTEGFNNKIKRLQRLAEGRRHAHHRQKRILASCGKT
jgi:transposase